MIQIQHLIAVHKILGLHLNRYYLALLEHYGTFEEVWRCNDKHPPFELAPALWERFLQERLKIDPQKMFEEYKKKGIAVVTRSDKEYSRELLQISSPPCILYYCGDVSLLNERAVAVVGSRRASNYGLSNAKSIAAELGKWGLIVVSGMARGIDSAAHEGALESGSKTLAVLGSGIDVIYPRENRRLFKAICDNGLIISEYAPGTGPLKANFPIRNRIISGLSQGVFIVEAKVRSGSLITADFALEQGKDIFALPGPVNNANSMGTLRLIQNGAKLVIHAGDILEELGYEYKEDLNKRRRERVQEITDEERSLLNNLCWEPIHADVLLVSAGVISERIHELLLNLELLGLIKELPGKYYVRT